MRGNVGSDSGPTAGEMNVACYTKQTKTVAVRVVMEENDDVQVVPQGTVGLSSTTVVVSAGANGFLDTVPMGDDVIGPSGTTILAGPNSVADTVASNSNWGGTDVDVATLADWLNKKVYNQAVFEWVVTKLPTMTVNFDTNRDGKVDVDTWMSGEMTIIRDQCKDDTYDYNIFLVDNPSDGSFGFMGLNQRYGFIHGNTSPHIPTTIAHELGHGAFGLAHGTSLGIPENLMQQGSQTKWRLFKGQWDSINP